MSMADNSYERTIKSLEKLKINEYELVCLYIDLAIAKGSFNIIRKIEYDETIQKLRENGYKVKPFFYTYKISWDKE